MATKEKLAGHELRGAVADKVFGRYGVTVGLRRVMYFSDPSLDGTRLFHDTPKYEVDMAAAWTVVERMRELGFHPSVRDCGDLREWVFYDHKLGHRREHSWATDTSDATAICRAALAAVE